MAVIVFIIFALLAWSGVNDGTSAFAPPSPATATRTTTTYYVSLGSATTEEEAVGKTTTRTDNQAVTAAAFAKPSKTENSNSNVIEANNVIITKQQPRSSSPASTVGSMVFGKSNSAINEEYQRGLVTIGFITLLFASNSPVLHAAFSSSGGGDLTLTPPPLLLNAAVSVVALVGLLLGGETLENNTDLPSTLVENKQQQQKQMVTTTGEQLPQEQFLEQSTTASKEDQKDEGEMIALRGGCELGLWKFLGTTANIYGLSLTTAAHGALLIQLTTLIVPVVQGIMGVPIPKRIQYSVVLALAGVVCFTQDPTGTPSWIGDILCVVAAAFYATYDLRLFSYGKQVAPRRLITGKIATQALLSLGLLFGTGVPTFLSSQSAAVYDSTAAAPSSALQETIKYIFSATSEQWAVLIPVVLWSGVVVNALAPFLQVGGQQAVGPTRCQTIYASQPLWAAIMSFVVFGETIGVQGIVGGSAFLTALFLAATADAPDPDCGKKQCEV